MTTAERTKLIKENELRKMLLTYSILLNQPICNQQSVLKKTLFWKEQLEIEFDKIMSNQYPNYYFLLLGNLLDKGIIDLCEYMSLKKSLSFVEQNNILCLSAFTMNGVIIQFEQSPNLLIELEEKLEIDQQKVKTFLKK